MTNDAVESSSNPTGGDDLGAAAKVRWRASGLARPAPLAASIPAPDWIALLSGAVLALTLGAVLFATLGAPIKDDVAWLLHVARAWMAGRQLYVDLIEVNPPLIVWLSAIPVALADLAGISPEPVAVGIATAAVTGCAWWSAILLRGYSPLFARPGPVFAAIAVALLAMPGVEFGQREHLLVGAALPYIALFARRLNGAAVPAPTAALVGLVAGLGCALKPQYPLAFLLLEAVARHRRLHQWRPEVVAAALVLLG